MTINKANGWLASDGTFFEERSACEQHDARTELSAAALAFGIDPERLMHAIDSLTSEIRRYIDAQSPIAAAYDNRPTANKNRKHQASDERAKNPTPPVQSLPADGRVNLSDLGRDTRTETIP